MSELSNQVYVQIQMQIKTIIQKLSDQQQGEGRLADDISGAMENLNHLNDQIQNELEKLKANSEWKRFTIAFYGETNAGKSTLIEALRLHLGEKTKQESQKKFKELQQKYGLTQESFDEVRRAIMSTEQAIDEVQQELAALSQKYAASIMRSELAVSEQEKKAIQESASLAQEHEKVIKEFESEILKLNELLENIKTEQNWWQKIIAFFSVSPEEKQLTEIKYQFKEVQKQQDAEQRELLANQQRLKQQVDAIVAENNADKEREEILITKKKQELQKEQQKLEDERQRLDNEAKKLAEFADGQIIGDGRSDYTRDNTAFDFNLGRQQFSLIDVPGIEGDEAIVSKPIEEAVRKAHAVFYVTRTARPPQTNDGDTGNAKGTLEKIKQHLGAQSEVWSIYNHPANSPRQLTSPLLNEDNRNSLAAMDEKLKIELKEQYCGSLVISARPAYLALTECIVPGSKVAAEKQKFLNNFGNHQSILSLSGLTDFVTRLQTTIVGDYRKKINHSNLNKAYKILETSLIGLRHLQDNFTRVEKDVRNELSSAQKQIDIALEEFINSLISTKRNSISTFMDRVEENVYNEIKTNISNDEFKRALQTELEKETKHLQAGLGVSIKKESDSYVKKIQDIIKRSSKHLKDIVAVQNNKFDFQDKFNIKIDTDNGLKISGLVAGGVGAALGVAFLVSNPVGWTVAFIGGVLALVGSLVGIAKSAWGFFDSDYKKSQQKKETRRVLDEAEDLIEKEITKVVTQIKLAISAEVTKIKNQLEEPVNQCVDINKLLKAADAELTVIARNIKS